DRSGTSRRKPGKFSAGSAAASQRKRASHSFLILESSRKRHWPIDLEKGMRQLARSASLSFRGSGNAPHRFDPGRLAESVGEVVLLLVVGPDLQGTTSLFWC